MLRFSRNCLFLFFSHIAEFSIGLCKKVNVPQVNVKSIDYPYVQSPPSAAVVPEPRWEMGDASPATDLTLEAWMSQLPAWTKERSICELALPGAHNAAATSVECIPTNILASYLGETLSNVSLIQMLAKPVAKVPALCQSDSIFCLLQRGIRLLDLRLGMHHQEIHICHTVVCSTMLRGVLVELRRFLHEHPEEVVVLLIKRDWEHRYFDTNENWLKTQEMLKEELGEMLMLEEDMKQPIRSLVKQGRIVLAMLEMPQFVTHIGFGVLITNGNLLSSWRASDQTARDQLERIETWYHNGLLKPQAGCLKVLEIALPGHPWSSAPIIQEKFRKFLGENCIHVATKMDYPQTETLQEIVRLNWSSVTHDR